MTKIKWTNVTWNPLVGCSIASPGCKNCYAMALAARIERMNPKLEHYRGLTKKVNGNVVWTGKVNLAPESTLSEPFTWRKSRTVFVNSMSDLFHENVPDEWIDNVFAVMALTPRHTYQVLTKRSARMREYVNGLYERAMDGETNFARDVVGHCEGLNAIFGRTKWPFPNVWLGVSCERQQEADERIPDLLATPAAVRFVSAEPLLGPIDFTSLPSVSGIGRHLDALSNAGCVHADIRSKLDWVIVGGESGPDARRLWMDNLRSIVRQCRDARVPVFVKQLGANVQDRNDAGFDGDHDSWPWEHDCEGRIEENLSGYYDGYQGAPVRIHLKNRKGADPSEWPPELRVREWPQPLLGEAA